jgi:hypothetical protein
VKYGPDERWTDWATWFEAAWLDVTGLTSNRLMWRNLVAMLQTNPAIEHHSHVNNYLTRTYAQMQAVGIRRQWDRKDRRPTIGRILHEISRYPEAATRTRYLQALTDPERDGAGWLMFSPADTEQIDPQLVAADLHRIDNRTADARDYVNSMVAHLDHDRRTGPVGSGDWFGDLNQGIDVLAEMTKKYWGLFYPGDMLVRVTPVPDLAWIKMFQTAWYSPEFVPVTPKPHDV